MFSWTDKHSFIEIYDSIKQIYGTNAVKQQSLPKLIIGTKFDQIVHSDIDEDLVTELETLTKSKIIRFSTLDCSFDQISPIMCKICEILCENDQRMNSLRK